MLLCAEAWPSLLCPQPQGTGTKWGRIVCHLLVLQITARQQSFPFFCLRVSLGLGLEAVPAPGPAPCRWRHGGRSPFSYSTTLGPCACTVSANPPLDEAAGGLRFPLPSLLRRPCRKLLGCPPRLGSHFCGGTLPQLAQASKQSHTCTMKADSHTRSVRVICGRDGGGLFCKATPAGDDQHSETPQTGRQESFRFFRLAAKRTCKQNQPGPLRPRPRWPCQLVW